MAKKVNEPNYGNWISKRLIYSSGTLGIVFSLLTVVFWVFAISAVLFLAVAAYFWYGRYLFSSKGRNVQQQVWNLIITNLDWNGEGKALDIGCGNGSLTINLARKFSKAQIWGIDYWGKRWEYSKNVCEANANVEGVNDRVLFEKASAVKLPFDDGYFDAAVSNLVFHEVSEAKDKRELIKEALRVVKKGGKFAFQDLFLFKQVYGDIDTLVADIKSWGVTKVEFVETRNVPFIPTALKLPFMLGKIGIIKGEK